MFTLVLLLRHFIFNYYPNNFFCNLIRFIFIQLGLFAKITLSNVPELVALLSHDESLNDMMALPPEDILLRWFNYQLEQTDCKSRVENFSEDIKVKASRTRVGPHIKKTEVLVGNP